MHRLLFFLAVALVSCRGGVDQARTTATGPASLVATSTPPGLGSVRDRLQDLANDAPLPGSDTPFLWLWWEGEVPADLPARSWRLEAFRQEKGLDGGGWPAFAAALDATFSGLRVYEFPEVMCHNCTRTLYVIEGRASWGVGGFAGHVFWDH